MKRIALLILGLMLCTLPFMTHAFAPKKGDKPCADCHKLDKKEADALVKKLVPTAKVTDIKMSPLKGAWQIEFESGDGKRGGFALDFSKKYLVQFAPIETVIKQQQPQPPRKVDVSKIPLADAVIVGQATAKNKVIVFSDPDCPYCRELHKAMKLVIAKRSDIAFAVILNPLPMHKEAPKKAQAILCTKSVELLDDAFAGKAVPEPTCSAEAVERSVALAQSLEFNGTPTLVRDDGLVLSGFLPEEKLTDWIDKK